MGCLANIMSKVQYFYFRSRYYLLLLLLLLLLLILLLLLLLLLLLFLLLFVYPVLKLWTPFRSFFINFLLKEGRGEGGSRGGGGTGSSCCSDFHAFQFLWCL